MTGRHAVDLIADEMNGWFAVRSDLIGRGFHGPIARAHHSVDPDALLRPYILDREGRRWLLDGSGDVA